MKLKQIVAALLVLLGIQSGFAATSSEDSFIDGSSFVYTFGANRIASNDSMFSFTLNNFDNDFGGFFKSEKDYSVTGGISGTKYAITQVTLDGSPWPATGSDINLGKLTLGSDSGLVVSLTGTRTGQGANFNGQLVLTPVPEPETYVLMLAGLGVVGFVASRGARRG
jgi:hypothetical protein